MAATEKKPSKRVPGTHVVYVRDDKGNRVHLVKSAWRRETHVRQPYDVEIDVQVKDDKSDKKTRKETVTRYRWVLREGAPSLKQWARGRLNEKSVDGLAAINWLRNKGLNTSKPQLCIGKTKKKKGSQKKS